MYFYDAFIICPVRGIDESELRRIKKAVKQLEKAGQRIYWPFRDTNQNDNIGLRICADNINAIRNSETVFVWWNDKSKGTLFDIGAALALNKKIVLLNISDVNPTETKSFENVLLTLTAINS